MTELQRLAVLSPDWDWSKCAVIAREWKYLEPVRACCEAAHIPVQTANEEVPNFWLLRETQELIDWLRKRGPQNIDGDSLSGWLDAQSPGPWIELLREAVEEHALETGGGAEVPVPTFIEWLAEWGREVRRRQRGLLLLTAHRAKGLEFDHVVVLDGGWDKIDVSEDRDAPRRLYYVAMTRARQTLALTRVPGPHRLLDELQGHPSVMQRGAERPDFVREPEAPAYSGGSHPGRASGLPPELFRKYRRPGLREVDLGFAGRRPANHQLPPRNHRAVTRRQAGGVRRRSGTMGTTGPCRNAGWASRQWLRTSTGDAVPFRHGPRRRRLEPGAVGLEVPRQNPVRHLGGGGAGVGV